MSEDETATLDNNDITVNNGNTNEKIVVCKPREQAKETYDEAIIVVGIRWCLQRRR